MLETAVSALVMLLVTIGPLESAALFAGLAANETPRMRVRMAVRATAIAGVVLLVFAFGGMRLLDLLHISLPAFRLAGGLLLLLVSIDLIFAHPSGLTSITSDEARDAEHRDIVVFPLAIPLIAGPGSMTAIVLLMTRSPDVIGAVVTVAVLICVLLITLVALLLAGPLTAVLRVTGINVFARVSGIILAALAMQLMLDGLKESGVFGG